MSEPWSSSLPSGGILTQPTEHKTGSSLLSGGILTQPTNHKTGSSLLSGGILTQPTDHKITIVVPFLSPINFEISNQGGYEILDDI